MKKLLILLVLALIVITISVNAETKRVTLYNKQSIQIEGKNITLVDSSPDSVIICVNGEKNIVSDDKTINNVFVRLIDGNEGSAQLRLEYSCGRDCKCDEDECNNNFCIGPALYIDEDIPTTTETSDVNIGETVDSIDVTSTIDGETTVEEGDLDIIGTNDVFEIITYVLIAIAIVVGIAYFTTGRRKDGNLDEFLKEEN